MAERHTKVREVEDVRVKKYKRQYKWLINSAQWPTGAAQSMSKFRQEAPGKNSHAGEFCLSELLLYIIAEREKQPAYAAYLSKAPQRDKRDKRVKKYD